MKSICVFAGSAKGMKESYSIRAKELGLEIARRNYSMVYGGGSKGLMGVVADAALEGGAEVTGIITEKLHDVEVGHTNLSSLEIVPSMHERKSRMAQLSDAIISLPGGVGTWEEFFEALAWNQLGIYSKPIVLFDVEGYYSKLFEFTEFSVQQGFLPETTLEEFFISDSVEEIFKFIESFKKRDTQDWFKRLGR
ncbi:MAG: TIGR00730 family Rossman fold protein [Gammaproteobacteria bacterium]